MTNGRHWKRQETVAYLLDKGADVNAPTRNEETPLHGAVLGEDRAIVEQLLANGADVNAQAVNGMTPLHRAVWQRSADIVALLLQQDADKHIPDNNGLTPLQLATAEEGEVVEGWGEAQAPDMSVIKHLQDA